MKFAYPASLNSWLKDFPQSFSLLCGREFNNLDGPWGEGSRINFAETPLSKEDQGNYTQGQELPVKQAIYTNTGDEDTWDARCSMYSWGSFYAEIGLNYYKLRVEKYFEIQSTYFETIKFSHTQTVVTEILTSVEIPNVYVPEEPPDNVYPPPIDPPIDPPPPPPVIGNPVQLDDHGGFWRGLVWSAYTLLPEVPSVPLWGVSKVYSEFSENDYIRVYTTGIDWADFVAAWNQYGLAAYPWRGLQVMLLKNWLGGGILEFFFKEQPEGSGTWRSEWVFLVNNLWYVHWFDYTPTNLVTSIRRYIGPPSWQLPIP